MKSRTTTRHGTSKNTSPAKTRKLEEQRERILREANEKANAILRDAKEMADETMKNFRKFGKEGISAAEMEKSGNVCVKKSKRLPRNPHSHRRNRKKLTNLRISNLENPLKF